MQAALNSTPSVASCGLYGPRDSKLWALSQIESLHLWDWAAAADEEVPGERASPPARLRPPRCAEPPPLSVLCGDCLFAAQACP